MSNVRRKVRVVSEAEIHRFRNHARSDRFAAMPRKPEIVAGIAWFRADQWQLLRSLSTDADELEETYEEWGRDCRKDCSTPHETGCTRAQSRCGRKRATGMVLGAKAPSGLIRQSPVCSCTSPRFAERLTNCWSEPLTVLMPRSESMRKSFLVRAIGDLESR